MHASIALLVMMVGGPMPPESEITTVPLNEDLSNVTTIQDQEWKERVKRNPLPRVPTVDNRQSGDDGRTGKNPYSPLYPPTGQHPMNQALPVPPTSPDAPTANGGYGNAGGYNRPAAGIATNGGGSNPPVVSRNNLFPNAGQSPVGTYGNGPSNVVPSTPVAPVSQGISGIVAGNSVSQIASRYGLSSPTTPMGNSAAGGNKPFNNYQAPSGYSPWSLLNQQTNNGTISPYTAYVQPAINQQNFNSHISEQINGVQTMRGYGAGTPGMEVNSGGNGLVNPYNFINYSTH